MELIQRINNSHIYNEFTDVMRNYFSGSHSKEELNSRMEFLFRITSYFFLRNGPRNKQKPHVVQKLAFYKENIPPKSSVIDVGCFDGYYTQQLRDYGCNIIGVVANNQVLNKTRKMDPNGEYVNAFAESLPFPDSSFDFGLYSHIFHHILNPEEALEEARRVIKPDGKIIISVPLQLGVDANHLRSFDQSQLETMVGKYFPNITYFSSIGRGHGCIASK